jgi:hypothetical protein
VLSDFWTGLGGTLAERWIALVFSPAFAFWAGGLAAWVWRYGRPLVSTGGWKALLDRWAASLQGLPVVAQGALVVGLLLVIVVSNLIVQRLSASVLRLLEGYWPRWLDWLRDPLVRHRSKKIDRGNDRLRQLMARGVSSLTASESADFVRLDRQRRDSPGPKRRMPTRLGNILRASEGRPGDYYGLDAVVCWPQLWLLLPDAAKQEVSAARASLNAAAQLWLWAVLFIGWTVWAWWALPLGILVAAGSYSRMLGAATIYAELVEGCYDVHRRLLYEALRWPLPVTPAEERQRGEEITAYLWRGSGSKATTPTFTGSRDQDLASAAAVKQPTVATRRPRVAVAVKAMNGLTRWISRRPTR